MYNTPVNNQLIFSTIHCFVSPWNTSPKTIFCENSHQSAKTFEIFFWKEKKRFQTFQRFHVNRNAPSRFALKNKDL